jgi:hypothetical protein
VESVLVNHPAVNEAAAIGVPDAIKGSSVVCFCVLAPGFAPSDELRAELQAKIAAEMGKPLQPKEIWFVSDIPKTRNAKVMRRIIRSAYLGEDPGDTSSLVNPEAVGEVYLPDPIHRAARPFPPCRAVPGLNGRCHTLPRQTQSLLAAPEPSPACRCDAGNNGQRPCAREMVNWRTPPAGSPAKGSPDTPAEPGESEPIP